MYLLVWIAIAVVAIGCGAMMASIPSPSNPGREEEKE